MYVDKVIGCINQSLILLIVYKSRFMPCGWSPDVIDVASVCSTEWLLCKQQCDVWTSRRRRLTFDHAVMQEARLSVTENGATLHPSHSIRTMKHSMHVLFFSIVLSPRVLWPASNWPITGQYSTGIPVPLVFCSTFAGFLRNFSLRLGCKNCYANFLRLPSKFNNWCIDAKKFYIYKMHRRR